MHVMCMKHAYALRASWSGAEGLPLCLLRAYALLKVCHLTFTANTVLLLHDCLCLLSSRPSLPMECIGARSGPARYVGRQVHMERENEVLSPRGIMQWHVILTSRPALALVVTERTIFEFSSVSVHLRESRRLLDEREALSLSYPKQV